MLTVLKRLVKEEKGQGMAEYGLILALVAVVAIAGLYLLGPTLKEKFTDISNEIKNPTDPTPTPAPEGE